VRAGAARVGLVATAQDAGERDTALTGSEGVVPLAAPRDAAGLAAELFTLLREAEAMGLDALVIEAVAEQGIGQAVMDRLRRAVEASGGTTPA
jgi:L-threonylcarbamoyladenylate synthase